MSSGASFGGWIRYNIHVNKKFQYVRVYRIVKHIKGETNAASKFVQRLIDKYIAKKNEAELDQETP